MIGIIMGMVMKHGWLENLVVATRHGGLVRWENHTVQLWEDFPASHV